MTEEDNQTLNLKLSAESAQLVRSLLERHRRKKEENSNLSEKRSLIWVASRDFTVEVGKNEIRDYILTWQLQPCWLYGVDFLCSTEEEHHTFYHYRACFSAPTPRRPIQGTASVYFTVGVSKVKPGTVPVEVLFIVESNRLAHIPGRTTFREQWLTDIIESKTLLRREVHL